MPYQQSSPAPYPSKMMKDYPPKDPPRKRVARACDRCRLKKGKCDGKEQCAKCVSADVMCIYTDRKPPQNKLISPAVAEALQSENLTLKRATVVLYKQLAQAQTGKLPKLDGVDWSSDKVLNGKSGRALHHIFQDAGIDNRISNEDIMSYVDDGDSSDSGRQHSNSPAGSRQSSPQSAVSEPSQGLWNNVPETAQKVPRSNRESPPPKKRAARRSYHGSGHTTAAPQMHMPQSSTAIASFIDPNILQTSCPPNSFSHPPTPPSTLDMDYIPSRIDTQQSQQMSWAEQQPRYYSNGLLLERYPEQVRTPISDSGSMDGSLDDNSQIPWNSEPCYQYIGNMGMRASEQDLRKVIDSMDVSMYEM